MRWIGRVAARRRPPAAVCYANSIVLRERIAGDTICSACIIIIMRESPRTRASPVDTHGTDTTRLAALPCFITISVLATRCVILVTRVVVTLC